MTLAQAFTHAAQADLAAAQAAEGEGYPGAAGYRYRKAEGAFRLLYEKNGEAWCLTRANLYARAAMRWENKMASQA